MSPQPQANASELLSGVHQHLDAPDLAAVSALISTASSDTMVELLERLPHRQRAVVYRLLPKDQAVVVFERLSPLLQSDLISGLQTEEVATIFATLEPDDRVWLLDELPSSLAPQLLQGLSVQQRQLTAHVLGYPKGSVGRRMSPEYVSTRPDATVASTLERIHSHIDAAETIYTVPVIDNGRHVAGIVTLRDLLRAQPATAIADIMQPTPTGSAYDDAETVSRTCAEHKALALPIVDKEGRLVGILTLDDAIKILQQEEAEDLARHSGVEPLRRPYFSTPLRTLVTSRIVWLLVLAIGATLTVHVLSVFEATLAEMTVLALFVPLLIGTGGNTGNQAATTVTRALALGEVRLSDLGRVFARELSTGVSLGALLGLLGGGITALAYSPAVGLVIGLTLLAVCSMAAAVGGIMPMIARALRVDPAVFSNPFITTFVDASGLVIYFLVARAVLGI